MRVFERISTTGNFFYMIKGYDEGDDVEADKDEMELKYNEIVQDYVFSMNGKNIDIALYGKIAHAKNEVYKLAIILSIIDLKIQENKLRKKVNLEENNAIIKELLSAVKVEKSDDLEKQKSLILRKIEKYKNEISEAAKKIQKDEPTGEPADINDIVVSVGIILERDIDMDKVTLYQFGKLQEFAEKKIEKMAKNWK